MEQLASMNNAPQPDRPSGVRRGIRLEYLTIGWNLLEGLVAVVSGTVAGSVALVGFGVDSFIECSSGSVLLWRLHAERRGQSAERVERIALHLVGVSFLLLAAYVAFQATADLWNREAPERSSVGIALAILSLIVMPWLAHQKRQAARSITSAALHADARQTSLCVYLSAIMLGGLLLNAIAGWWWADPAAALAMTPIIIREGIVALRGERCHDCV